MPRINNKQALRNARKRGAYKGTSSVLKRTLYRNAIKRKKSYTKKERTDWLLNKVLGIDGIRENIVRFMPDLKKQINPAKIYITGGGRRAKPIYWKVGNKPSNFLNPHPLRIKSQYYFPSVRPSYKNRNHW